MQRAAEGLQTFETVEGLGPYPVRVLTQPVREAGRVTSLIQVGMSLESVAVTRRRFLLVMATVLPLALLFAGGGGWILARRALRPVDRMTEAARRISAEHLNERLETTGSDDELDRLAATLNEMLGRLDAAFQQVRQFSADASHELQTPLTILKGELEVALRAPRSPDEYHRVLASALEESERIARLVEGLLLLSRADAGVLRMDRQPVDLAKLMAEVSEYWASLGRGTWGSHGVQVSGAHHHSGGSRAPSTASVKPCRQWYQVHPRRWQGDVDSATRRRVGRPACRGHRHRPHARGA